jgi:glycosyltransferase involved in cell wall biosynthesis
MKPALRIIALTKQDSQYGAHSGYYTQAFLYGRSAAVRIQTIIPRPGWIPRGIGKLLSIGLRTPRRNQSEQTAEAEYVARMWLDRRAVGHIANIEDHLPLAHAPGLDRSRWVATVHFPIPSWRADDLSALRDFARIITLCRRDADALSKILPEGRTLFVLHGVDTAFFYADETIRSPAPRLLFVGKWLRDFNTAGRVLIEALTRCPHLKVDIVVKKKWISGSVLERLDGHPRVLWHDSVDDETLRRLYQTAWILLMPLFDTSANNALVEALACGTVPVINRVGGVVDYGGGAVFPICPTSNSSDFLALVDAYMCDTAWLRDRSRACRNFAVNHLDWRFFRDRMQKIYEDVSNQRRNAGD